MKPKHHILVCTSSRINGQQKGFCHNKHGVEIVENFLSEISDRDLEGEVMVSNTGCFGLCEQGPMVVVYPENVWYSQVSPDDVEEIMDEHIEEGRPLERLLV